MRRTLLLATLALTGCSDQGFTSFDIVDVFRQNPPDEVDILMVVDDSCSMGPYQETLGANFDQFISWFIEADVDYQIGVVTTDIIDERKAGLIQGQIITTDTPNAAVAFGEIVNVGIDGAGYETGLEAARMALSDPMLATANAGFIRDDASLSIIFVSDEQDGSPDGVNDYINDFVAVKGARNRDVFNASALVVSDLGQCTGDAALQSTEGTRYMDVALQTGGVVGNLCESDFESIVFDLSLASTRLQNIYYLRETPTLPTLQVSVDDEIIGCDTGRWTYEEVMDEFTGELRPAIVFDVSDMPPVGAQIAARYFGGTPDLATFCQE